MRSLIISLIIVTGLTLQGFGGVIHESKSIVKFKGLGQYATHEIIYIQGMKQYKESLGQFQGEGMMGQMVSGLLFGDKSKGEITDLDAMKVFELFKEKRQYTERPIEKIRIKNEEYGETGQNEAEEETPEESNIKITRQEFKVVPTHKTKTIHNFPCKEYHIFWITEWINTETGDKGKDSLFTDVWTTEKAGTIEKGLKEEMDFQKAYLQKIGLDAAFNSQSILGLNWLQMFRNMKHGQAGETDFNETKWAKEMQKIKGYPVLIDGEFYVYTSKKNKVRNQSEQQNFDISNPTGMFGKMLKKSLKKKARSKTKKNEPAFAYHTELVKIKVQNIDDNKFKVPEGYQKIN